MDRQRIINLLAAISAITVFGFTLGLMFPLLSLIMEREGIPSKVIGYSAALQPLGIVLSVFAIPPMVRRFGAKVVVLGATVAEKLFGASADPLGQLVRIKGVPFLVVGG